MTWFCIHLDDLVLYTLGNGQHFCPRRAWTVTVAGVEMLTMGAWRKGLVTAIMAYEHDHGSDPVSTSRLRAEVRLGYRRVSLFRQLNGLVSYTSFSVEIADRHGRVCGLWLEELALGTLDLPVLEPDLTRLRQGLCAPDLCRLFLCL
jgi:hypothetical protein